LSQKCMECPPPVSRPHGCVQANYQQLFLNLQFTYCILRKLHKIEQKGALAKDLAGFVH